MNAARLGIAVSSGRLGRPFPLALHITVMPAGTMKSFVVEPSPQADQVALNGGCGPRILAADNDVLV